MKQKNKKIAEVAALAGRIMLESHAESYRVEDTVVRIMKTSGLSITEAVSTTTGLFLTLDDEDDSVEPVTLVRRISERGNHLNKIYRVNNISRMLTSGEITPDEAYERLQVVDESEYTAYRKDIATIMIVVSFTILLNGSIWDVLFSFLAGMVVAISRFGQEWLDLNSFINGIFSTFLTSLFITLGASLLPGNINSHIVTIAALMPLYPGTAFTNGIRDTLKGDYVSGIARIADAIVIALSLAIGVAIGLYVAGRILAWI